MNGTANQIAHLILTPNLSAPSMTHALAELGNGSMQNGIRRMVSYYTAMSASNLRLGRIQGGIAGVLGTTAIAGGIALAYHLSQKKQLETEGKVILDVFQNASTENKDIIENISTEGVKDADINNNTPDE